MTVVSSILMIIVVLLQQGKGAELGAAFGRGAQGGLFEASGKANFLSRLTSALALVFLMSSLALSVFVGKGDDGVLQDLEGSTTDAVNAVQAVEEEDEDAQSARSLLPEDEAATEAITDDADADADLPVVNDDGEDAQDAPSN